MGRASKKDAGKHRQEIVTAASQLFRARGIGNVSVPELMAAAGLTHGGFYGHFDSKTKLAAEALAQASDEIGQTLAAELGRPSDDGRTALDVLVSAYLSRDHRDHPEHGCPTAALIDYARDAQCPELDSAYLAGVDRMIAAVETALPAGAERWQALSVLSTLIGGLLLARATAGTPLSDAFLDAVRSGLGAAPLPRQDEAEPGTPEN